MSRSRPLVLEWQRTLRDFVFADVGSDRPAANSVLAVAACRVSCANSDGTSCFPSRTSLARWCGIRDETVRRCDEYLVDRGFMIEVRRRPGNVREFRLVLLESDRPLADQPSSLEVPALGGESAGAPVDALEDESPAIGIGLPETNPGLVEPLVPPPVEPPVPLPGANNLRPPDLQRAAAHAVDPRHRAQAHLDQHVEYRLSCGYRFEHPSAYVSSQLPDAVTALAADEDLEARWPTRSPNGSGGTERHRYSASDLRPSVLAPTNPADWQVSEPEDGPPVARPRACTPPPPSDS
jgi:hypothetical protein